VSPRGAAGPPDIAEFPLDPGPGAGDLAAPEPAAAAPGDPTVAPLASRFMAATGDLAATVLGVSLPIVAASALRGRWPTAAGLAWAAGFGFVLSLALTVAALFLLGRTPGMSLAGLSIRPDATGRRPAVSQAALRWTGTLLAALTLGLPLLWTSRNPEAATLADLISGRPLVHDEDEDVES